MKKLLLAVVILVMAVNVSKASELTNEEIIKMNEYCATVRNSKYEILLKMYEKNKLKLSKGKWKNPKLQQMLLDQNNQFIDKHRAQNRNTKDIDWWAYMNRRSKASNWKKDTMKCYYFYLKIQ